MFNTLETKDRPGAVMHDGNGTKVVIYDVLFYIQSMYDIVDVVVGQEKTL